MACFSLDKAPSDILQEIISYTHIGERHVIKLVNSNFRDCVQREIVKEVRSRIKDGLCICIRIFPEYVFMSQRYRDNHCITAVISRLDWTRNRMQVTTYTWPHITSNRIIHVPVIKNRRDPIRLVLWCDMFADFGKLWAWKPPRCLKKLGGIVKMILNYQT